MILKFVKVKGKINFRRNIVHNGEIDCKRSDIYSEKKKGCLEKEQALKNTGRYRKLKLGCF